MMNETEKAEKLVQIVKDLNSGYKNQTEPTPIRTTEIGPIKIHALGFRGEKGRWYTNYVTDYNDDLRGFQYLEDAIPEISKGFGFKNFVAHNFRVVSLSALAFLMVATACIWVLITKSDIEILVGLIGGAFGYIAGKRDTG